VISGLVTRGTRAFGTPPVVIAVLPVSACNSGKVMTTSLRMGIASGECVVNP